mgnify:CR=1 FL=1
MPYSDTMFMIEKVTQLNRLLLPFLSHNISHIPDIPGSTIKIRVSADVNPMWKPVQFFENMRIKGYSAPVGESTEPALRATFPG